MIRDPGLTNPAEAQVTLGHDLKTMRFVLQLALRDSAAWSVRNPQQALGGIRAALCNCDQPVAAQALGLLAASETLISLDELARRPHSP